MSAETRDRIKTFGKYSETMEDIIIKALDALDTLQREHNENNKEE